MVELSSFTCICPQKRLILSNKEETLREQEKALKRLVEESGCKSSAILPGGCLFSTGNAVGHAAGFASVVRGELEDRARIIDTYLPNVASQSEGSIVLTDAEIICHLYKSFGRVVPQKLHGDFSFVLFDPAQGRVLAAVSPTSRLPLTQARGSDGCLLITSGPPSSLPSGSHSVLSIPPGYMKYGWSSDPQQYSTPPVVTPQRQVPLSASAKAHAARAAFSGLESRSPDGAQDSQTSVQTSGPSFADSEGGEPQSPAPKKTRRGKRGGRNQKLRAESLKQISSGELGRTSIDFATLPSANSLASSFGSRADEQSWWRTNTPRQSLELPSFTSSSGFGCTPPPRRFSMSATAPAFVPGQPGLFTRQSVPAARAQTTALSFPGRTKAPQAFLVGPKAGVATASEEASMISPFFDSRMDVSPRLESPKESVAVEGKADAAWEDEPHSPAAKPALSSEAGSQKAETLGVSQKVEIPDSVKKAVAKEEMAQNGRVERADLSSGSMNTAESGSKEMKSLPRVAIGRRDGKTDHSDIHGASPKGGSPLGGSPKGMSPGESPTNKPPKIPLSAFRHFLKSMIPKRSSQVDLWAEAGPHTESQRNWAKSSSHGNLVGLQATLNPPEMTSSKSCQVSGSESLPHLPGIINAAHRVTPREDTARDLAGKPHAAQEELLLRNLKLSEHPLTHGPTQATAAQWIARKTRSMFGKSKSCTDLHQIDGTVNFPPAGMQVK